jgi:4'-phosphopantetheinyl transferase EntD
MARGGRYAAAVVLLSRLLPETVVTVALLDDPVAPGGHEAELRLVASAGAARRQQFAQGRWCAHTALERLGRNGSRPILAGPAGEPLWPDGVAGSITHCPGFTAAAVAPVDLVRAIGIDAEPAGPLPDGVFDVIALPAEREALAGLARRTPSLAWDRVLFCVKEAAYKAWYPLTGQYLDFDQVTAALDADRRTFEVHLPTSSVSGRWTVGRGLVLAAATVPTEPKEDRHDGAR